jgi:hypothetical protein
MLALEFPCHLSRDRYSFAESGPAEASATASATVTLALVTGAELMPCDPNQQGRDDRRAKDDPQRGFCEIAARRLLGELPGDEFKIGFEQTRSRFLPGRPPATVRCFCLAYTRYARDGLLRG